MKASPALFGRRIFIEICVPDPQESRTVFGRRAGKLAEAVQVVGENQFF